MKKIVSFVQVTGVLVKGHMFDIPDIHNSLNSKHKITPNGLTCSYNQSINVLDGDKFLFLYLCFQ